jgi:hypothetical protein
MPTSADIAFMKALKGVGLERARDLFSCVEAWENGEEEGSKPTLSKNRLRLVTDVGQAFGAKVKRQGREADPNSRFQRVIRETADIISKEREYRTQEHNVVVAKKLGISVGQVRMYNQEVRKKLNLSTVSYGIWKKAA